MTAEQSSGHKAASMGTIDGIVNILKDIITQDLSISVTCDEVDEHASLEDDLGLDSVALFELIGAIEERLGFEFHESDLRTRSFKSLHTLAQVISKRMGNR